MVWSDDFNRAVEGRDDLVVSDLAITEIVSALSRQLRRGSVTRERTHRVRQDIAAAVTFCPSDPSTGVGLLHSSITNREGDRT